LRRLSVGEIVIRFLVGGAFVSAFAVLSDVLTPKSFAGLFGAAPSIALATLLMTAQKEGPGYMAVEAKGMIGGAIAFGLYAWCVAAILVKGRWSAKAVTPFLLLLWLVVALGYRLMFLL
jgi:uncharacterized protein DUF3147